ncbi:MAG TPA: hypothetical protein PLX16_00735 [Exilispira sp.]|nr:hypothetical protein [Exilispira sp.]
MIRYNRSFKTFIYYFFCLSFILFVLVLTCQTLYADSSTSKSRKSKSDEQVIWQTNIFKLDSLSQNYSCEMQIVKKLVNGKIHYEFKITILSKVFANIKRSSLTIKTKEKDLNLSVSSKGYSFFFDKESQMWSETNIYHMDEKGFNYFSRSASSLIILKGKNLSINAIINSQVMAYILDIINYSKESGQDIEPEDSNFFYVNLVPFQLGMLNIMTSESFTSLGLQKGTVLYPENAFTVNNMVNSFSISTFFVVKFMIFSGFYLDIGSQNAIYHRSGDDTQQFSFYLFDFSIVGKIKLFTIFNFMSLSLGIGPGFFYGAVCDDSIFGSYPSNLYPILDSSTFTQYFAFDAEIIIDIKVLSDLYLSLIFSTIGNANGLFFMNIRFVIYFPL